MPYKFNVFTGNLDLVDDTSGFVVGPASATDNAIARYDGTTGKLIQNSLAIVQDGGAVQAQEFVFNRQILADVTVPDHYTVFSTDMEIVTGDIILQGDAELFLI